MLNERELHARYEIMLETYNKTVNVEGQLMVLMANRYILPAALRRIRSRSAQSVAAVKAAGGKSVEGKKLLDELTKLTDDVQAAHRQAARRRSRTRATASAEKHAKHFRDAVVPAMAALRETGDALEMHHPARAVAARHLSRDAVHQVARGPTSALGRRPRSRSVAIIRAARACRFTGRCRGDRAVTSSLAVALVAVQ